MYFRNDIPPELLRQMFVYDPETGHISWRARPDRSAFSSVSSRGYLTGAFRKVSYKAHRIAWVLHYGTWPGGEIDHINRNKADNRIANLRCISHSANMENCPPRGGPMRGVRWHPQKGRWQARIEVKKREIHLGYFDSSEAAIDARRSAELRYSKS